MAKGNWTGTAASTQIVADDGNRDFITIQMIDDTAAAFLGFGEAATASEGIKLLNKGDVITVRDHLARGAINGLGNGAVCTYQTGDLTMHPNYIP